MSRARLAPLALSACLLMIGAPQLFSETASPLAREAAAAWAHRGDQPEAIQHAIRLWDQAYQQDSRQNELLIDLTRACGSAYRKATTPAERAHWANEGRRYGVEAVQANPNNSQAFAEYAAALGQWAEAHKGISSLKTVKEAIAQLDKAVLLDPRNDYAHMLLSSFYRGAPPFISVGDKKKALTEAQLAVQYGPESPLNHLTLARAYLANGETEPAKRELETALRLPPVPSARPESLSDQETARQLLAQLGGAPPAAASMTTAPATTMSSVGVCVDSTGAQCQ